jgi:hypothetical protein
LSQVAYGQGNVFNQIRYNGGAVQSRVEPDDWDNRLTIAPDAINLVLTDGQVVRIDPKTVTGLSYGQEAHRRVGTMVALGILVSPLALFGLFHKTRLHFVGIEYTTAEGKRSALLLQAHKDNYRAVLVALQGVTRAPLSIAPEDRKYVPASVTTVAVEPGKNTKADSTQPLASGPAMGIIKLTSVPDEAEIRVNGSLIGMAPADLKLSVGKYKIQVQLEGYEEWDRDIEVFSDSVVTLTAKLKKKD